MTTFNTGNPIGSTDARDRSDNSENLDLAVNSLALTFEDRFGVTRDTLEGIYQKSAYYRAGTFDAGYTLTNNRQTLAYGNIEYSWFGAFPKVVAAGSTPATTGGIGAGAWVDRTDVSLRSEIGNVDGAGLIGSMNYAELRAYSGAQTTVNIWGIGNIFDGAAGVFKVDVSDTTSPDNGGTILVDALNRRWKRVITGDILVDWWGLVSDYNSTDKTGTDNSPAFFSAMSYAATNVDATWQGGTSFTEAGRKVTVARTGNYKITSPILIASGILLDLKNSEVGGAGWSDTDTDVFVTAYINSGVLTSNLALGAEVGRVMSAGVQNFRITNVRRGWNFKNFNEGCFIKNGYAYNVQQCGVASRCFYASFNDVICRGAAGGTLKYAFEFDSFVNLQNMRGLSATDRVNTMLINGGANGLEINGQSYEGSTNGLTLKNEVYPANIHDNYFEGLTGTGLDLSDSGTKRNVNVDSNWFFGIGGTAIYARNMQGGKIGNGNYFDPNNTMFIDINDVVSTCAVEISPDRVADNAASLKPSLPAKYSLGAAVNIKYRSHIFSSASGSTVAVQNYAGDNPAEFPYSGKQGYVSGKVPFCDHSKTAGTTFNVVVSSKINYDPYLMATFVFNIADNINSYTISGRVSGGSVYIDNAAGKTVTASNVGGYLTLTISSFSSPTQAYRCEGVLRHM